MKCVVLITLAIASVAFAKKCTPEVCTLKDGCVCTSGVSPIETAKTPQFVVLSIDDAIIPLQYESFYKKLTTHKNPDGNPISATFFIPHEYTDYAVVNQLYNVGFEIGDNSISKNTANYWATASEDTFLKEFQGQKQIISKFANIPEADILGARIPQFQLGGNKLFRAYQKAGLQYDSSWTTRSDKKLFPYTLHFDSTQDCLIGSCPTESFKDIWVVPINNIKGNDTKECNVLFSCNVEGDAKTIKNWLIEEFNKTYKDERAPFQVLVNSVYFQFFEHGLEGFYLFLDYLKTLKDVFIVSDRQLIDWMRNPVPLDKYKTVVPKRNQPCQKVFCQLKNIDGNERWMSVCGKCPEVYPWLGNPEGKA